MRGLKNDGAGRAAWGGAYDAIPKSVFAIAAWHLANAASGDADLPGAAEKRMIDEIAALRDNGFIDEDQANRAIKAIGRV